MTINLESSWDYYRKLNFIILTIIILGLNIGISFFEKFNLTIFLILTFLNLILLFFLFLQKSILIKNQEITSYHSFFGIKIKTIKILPFRKDSIVSWKSFRSANSYQKKNRYEPMLHVEETIFENYIDDKLLITLYNGKAQEKFLNFVKQLKTENR